MGRPPAPPNHLVMAIVTTILCCLPLGIVSLVYSNQVNSKYQMGDYAGAQDASAKARTWWIASIAVTAVLVVGYLVLLIAGVVAFSNSENGNVRTPF